MKKLSIILPFYGEDLETIEPMLSSINNQQACTPSDFELILVNDCGPSTITEEDVKKYLWKFDSKIIKMKENGGPGNARQLGIDASKAEYVMMGDCDDVLQNNMVFYFFETQLYKDQPDVAHTNWMSHHYVPTIGNIIQPMNVEFTWFFGKFYKRSFLEQNKLRMHPNLRVHEELQIVRLAPYYTDNIKHYDFPTYIWSTSEGSITRKNNGEYAYTGNATYLYSNDLLLDRAVEKREPDALQSAYAVILLGYTSDVNIDWTGPAKDYKKQTDEMASYFINKWLPRIEQFTEKHPEFKQNLLQEYKNMQSQLEAIPDITFNQWVKDIKALGITELPEFIQPDTTTVKKGK